MLPVAMPQIVAGVLGLSVVGVGAWIALADDPLGGEPIAVARTKPNAVKDEAAAQPAPGDKMPVIVKAGETTPPPGSTTVTIIDGSSGKKQDVVIPGKSSSAAPDPKLQKLAADPKLLEQSRHGNLPKISSEGMRPAVAYARPLKLPPDKVDAPRIALVVGGLGISATATADALANLPAPVTFAFAPYSNDLESLVLRARASDHEVMVQAPMEPFDYPDNDPGPQTLLTSLSADQNIDRLQWLMSRMQGYVGVATYMGSRFTASEQAMGPALREIGKRGLILFEDGASSRSVAGQVAGSINLPFVRADIVVDATPTPVEIDRALTRLEMAAKEKGSAVGYATALPGTIARIAQWAKAVPGRGIVLVPITMAVKAKSS
ncbi:MAG: divergent polysaccharide deacetylase family protein [Pseudolabrys sp.]|nr:divergent polysaccharide deacetylase family protein [Pseudolabrys sp.]